MTTDVTAAETWQVTKPQTMKTSHMIQKQPGSYWPKTSCDLVAVVTADCELQHVGCSWRRKHSQRPQGMRRVFPDKSNTAVNRCVCSRREEQDEARTVRKVRGRCFHCHCEVKDWQWVQKLLHNRWIYISAYSPNPQTESQKKTMEKTGCIIYSETSTAY